MTTTCPRASAKADTVPGSGCPDERKGERGWGGRHNDERYRGGGLSGGGEVYLGVTFFPSVWASGPFLPSSPLKEERFRERDWNTHKNDRFGRFDYLPQKTPSNPIHYNLQGNIHRDRKGEVAIRMGRWDPFPPLPSPCALSAGSIGSYSGCESGICVAASYRIGGMAATSPREEISWVISAGSQKEIRRRRLGVRGSKCPAKGSKKDFRSSLPLSRTGCEQE